MSLAVGQSYMLRINVMTTATPRTELHQITLEPALKILSEHFDVRLYITLDDVLDEVSFKKSMKYLETLPTRQTHLMPGKLGSFKLVTKRLYDNIIPEPNDIFLWLEDDWILQEDKVDDFITALKEFPDSDYDFIVTTIYEYIGGNPLVFKRRFFDEMQEYYILADSPLDPEIVMWNIETAIWGDRFKAKCQFLRDTFVDAGRDWREERGIVKENKRSNAMTTWR